MTDDRLTRADRSALMRDERHRAIMAAAMDEAAAVGFANVRRNAVARRAGVANGSVNHAFGTLDALKDAIMAEAVASLVLPIVAQGLAAGHPAAHNAPPAIRKAAAGTLA